MNVDNETIEVMALKRDATGQPIEPEEAPARRVLHGSSPIGLKTFEEVAKNPGAELRAATENPVGKLKTDASVEMPAGVLATNLSRSCFLCRHFDQGRAARYIGALHRTPEGQAELKAMLKVMLITKNSTPQEIALALGSFGVCGPMSEMMRDTVTVLPASKCPSVLGNGVVFGDLFMPRGLSEERASAGKRDEVMRAAQGKT